MTLNEFSVPKNGSGNGKKLDFTSSSGVLGLGFVFFLMNAGNERLVAAT